MNKPIIIDGVDVGKCNFRLVRDEKQMCECCHATGFGVICACEMWKDCPYKQLQRLKEENDGLKSQLDFEIMNKETLIYNCEKFREGNIKFKQALEEIKEIANEPCIDDEDCETCNENCMSKDIINKINEVLGD